MATMLEEQLLDVQLAEAKDKFEPEVLVEPDADVQGEGASRGKARYEANGGFQPLYKVSDGSVVYPPVSVLANKMIREKDDNGRNLWSLTPIRGKKYTRDKKTGQIMLVRDTKAPGFPCPLHKDAKERADMDRIGYPNRSCTKVLSDIDSRDRHFQKHIGPAKAWERWKTEAREQREQARSESLLEAVAKLLEAQQEKK